MKKPLMRIINTTGFSKFIKASAAALVLLSTKAVHAQAIAVKELPANAVVRYVGQNEDNIMIHVQYDNATGEKFYVTLKNLEGVTLFTQVYKDKKFDKNFHIPKMDNDKLTFIIKNVAEKDAEVFEVNSNIRTVEEVVIKKVG